MVDDAHCDQPMLHGFRKYRSPRGKCEIRGAGPNLWFAVAPALGFQVGSFRFSHSEFAQLLESNCPQAATLDAHTRRCNTLPEIISSMQFLCLVVQIRRIIGLTGAHPTCSFTKMGTQTWWDARVKHGLVPPQTGRKG